LSENNYAIPEPLAYARGSVPLILSRDRQKLRKNRPHAAKAGETACPTSGNTGLALVEQAVSPASRDFFTASQGAVGMVISETDT
jgi:hypothetical protein